MRRDQVFELANAWRRSQGMSELRQASEEELQEAAAAADEDVDGDADAGKSGGDAAVKKGNAKPPAAVPALEMRVRAMDESKATRRDDDARTVEAEDADEDGDMIG